MPPANHAGGHQELQVEGETWWAGQKWGSRASCWLCAALGDSPEDLEGPVSYLAALRGRSSEGGLVLQLAELRCGQGLQGYLDGPELSFL